VGLQVELLGDCAVMCCFVGLELRDKLLLKKAKRGLLYTVKFSVELVQN
jgi:hypothetical protein